MRTRSIDFAALSLVATALAAAALTYPTLPDVMATHWNAQGQVDGTSAKWLGAFVMPVIMALLWALFAGLSYISPKGFDAQGSERALRSVCNATLAFLLGVHVLMLGVALGLAWSVSAFVWPALGILLIVLGNYVGKVRRNFFVGIRTPWTLADEEVWLRTHRLGGKLMVVAGALVLLVSIFPQMHTMLPIAIVAAAALIPTAYSYVIYRRLHA